jgi:hypothetical protein
MIRDVEIQRLISYARGLGLEVTFSSKKSDCAAFWYLDNSGIVIFKKNNSSKVSTVLSLLHELGHSKHNIHEKDRQRDLKFEQALDHVDEAEELEIDSQKRQRKIILDNERKGTQYWDEIYTECNLQFPKWKLEMAKEYDIWHYEVFYETDKYPMQKEKRAKRKELVKKYRDT